MSRIPWRELAACLGHAPLFDQTIGDEQHCEVGSDRKERFAAARAICATCEVWHHCYLDSKVGRDEGMRFGQLMPPLAPSSRRRGPGMQSEAEHGTAAAARAHYRRGESTCERCRAAESELYQKKARKAS